jgi:pimeloyl-ACP methyl ester carboxylesterase
MSASNERRSADIAWRDRRVSIEYAWIDGPHEDDAKRPLVVFLHEGLGSRAMWKDFPRAMCEAANARGLVFSRPGYGASTPRAKDERWDVDYLHRQAYEVLPAFLESVGIDEIASPPWLLGHSDGASIALLYASRFPSAAAGLILLAPHVFVEPISVASIEAVRAAYLETDLRERLAKYHDDPESPFWGWNEIWLDRRFRDWNIEDDIGRIECPVLAVQGCEDEHGTMEQVHAIRRRIASTQVVALDDCRHSPHRDQPERLIEAVARFMRSAQLAKATR